MRVCVCMCLHIRELSRAAAAGWQPQRLRCPCACSWGNWEPRTAAETAECLSPVTAATHLAGSHFPAQDILPELTDRGQNEAVLVWLVSFGELYSLALLLCVAIYVHMTDKCAVYAHVPLGTPVHPPALMAGSEAMEM